VAKVRKQNPTEAEKPTESENDKLIARAKDLFERVQSYEGDQRIQELDDIRFVGMLEQWPEPIKRIREADATGARPCLVVDKVNQYKNQIVNNMRMNRPSIKVRPVDDIADPEVAEVLQGIVRHIEDESKADIAYDWAGEGAVTNGLGFFRVLTEYVGDTFNQEIRIARIPNRFSVYFDPNSREPDGSDATEVLVTEMVNKKKFEKEYPEAKNEGDWETTTGDNTNWTTDDEIRIAEYYHIEKVPANLYLTEDGNSVFEDEYLEAFQKDPEGTSPLVMEEDGKPKTRKGYKCKVHWCKLTAYDVLEKTTVPGKYIPIIPVIGIETIINGRRFLRGIVRGVKDAQRMYNYNRSIIAESLNLTVKAPFIGATGQFKSSGDKWAASNRVNYAFLEYDPVATNGQLAPPPQRQGFAGVPAGLVNDIQTSEHDIQSALGMYAANLGQDGEAKSGRALNAQQRQGDMATFHFPDNLSKSVRHCGRIIIGMIPEIYDTQRVVRILGDADSAEYAKIDPEMPEAKREERDDLGAVKKIYNLNVGKYDVSVSTGPSFATKRQEGAEFLTQIAQSSPDLMPIIGDLLFKSMDMPYAEEVAERLKKMMPPQLQDQPDGESPEVQQVKQQAQQIIDNLTQRIEAAEAAMAEADQEAKEIVAKAQDAETKNMLEAEKIRIDQYKAKTERYKVELDAALKAQAEINTEELEMVKKALAEIIMRIEPPDLQMDGQEPASAGFFTPETQQ
jgi:hypothetical protein